MEIALAAPPLPNTYWTLPGLLLAGEHPAGLTPEATRQRLRTLVASGIECFIDLTHPAEIDPYDQELPFHVEYLRKPIRDHGLPERREHMMEILDCLHDALRSGRPAYVHCRAGIGRTGMVVGCLLVERGLTGEQALDELARLWQQSERSKSWPSVPETEAQSNYVRRWKARKLSFSLAAPAAPPLGAPPPRPQPAADAPDPLLEPATLAAARSLRERFLGALLGLAVGDAVAAATQYRQPGTFTPIGDLIGGGPFELPRGAWSDDTAMALCLADSLLAADGFDVRDQVERYKRWQREGYLSATGQCLGITASTAHALAVAEWRRQLYSGSHSPNQLDPEPLSRVAPVVMFFFGAEQEALQFACDAARTTCQAPAVLGACRDLARALLLALSGRPKPQILAVVSAASAPRAARSSSTRPREREKARANHTATDALGIAFEAFVATGNFRDAVLHAANHGGNSDVAAAACGQLAGAHYGAAAIPAPWRDCLLERALIESYADLLLQHALLKMG
ncbi:MAG TPA: ADP-ribosylglycohydrolase family protein [Steroidobacteraceae bacterium]|jgi:ADP-ribosyl-[dinitrogen reductase] hydrolase|nr:ADP-ribosylglycohydrolase family protein [Steroidobacteraceae bacterium]